MYLKGFIHVHKGPFMMSAKYPSLSNSCYINILINKAEFSI